MNHSESQKLIISSESPISILALSSLDKCVQAPEK